MNCLRQSGKTVSEEGFQPSDPFKADFVQAGERFDIFFAAVFHHHRRVKIFLQCLFEAKDRLISK